MRKRLIGFGAVCLTTVSMLAGCGSKYSSVQLQYNSAESYDTAAAAAEESYMDAGYGVYESASEYYAEDAVITESEMADYGEKGQIQGEELSEEAVQTSERKLIRTVDLYTETEQYDELLVNLEAQISALGGYVEYRYQYNGNPYDNYSYSRRNSNLTVRIPAVRLDEFIARVGESSNIVNKEERVEDVTLRYVDLESHRNALITEQERLIELLEQAETVEDLIAIESRLSQVRYELESMESQLRTLMNQVSYSTVNLTVQEVQRLSPTEEVSIWGRMRRGLADTFYDLGMGFQNGFVGFVINLPYIVIWLIVIVILFFICRLLWRIFKKRYAKKIAMKAENVADNLQKTVKRKKRKAKQEAEGAQEQDNAPGTEEK